MRGGCGGAVARRARNDPLCGALALETAAASSYNSSGRKTRRETAHDAASVGSLRACGRDRRGRRGRHRKHLPRPRRRAAAAPPPPPVASYPQDLSRERVYPPRWSWIHWWEANRDPYLRSIRQSGALQRTDPAILAAYRAQAVKALVGGLGSAAAEVRAASALALARMNEKAALPAITKLAGADGSPQVRMMALVAMGLLDVPEARDSLLSLNYPTDQLVEAGCVGLGFLRAADEAKVQAALHQAVASPKAGAATISAWALRRRKDDLTVRLMRSILVQSKSPWLASEAILSLGEQGDTAAVPLLADVLLGNKPATSVAAYQALHDHDSEIARLLGDVRVPVPELERVRMLYQKQAEWRDFGPNGQGRTTPARLAIRVGMEKVYLSSLRASAAIALGRLRTPAASAALVASLAFRDDGYVEVFKGFAMMTLGQAGDPAALPPLLAYLGRAHPSGKVKTVVELDSPLRGFAALALGFYARPRETPQGPADAPDYDRVCLALAERLADPQEEAEVRTACAMGLGLTARTENLRYLQKAAETVRAADDLLAGYILLARALLGDQGITPLAKRYLDVSTEKKETSGILARRAAVLGLALLESQEAIPALLDAWHLTYHVNREVAVALGLLRAYNVTEPLVRLLQTSPNPLEQAFAARCLGELFMEERPYRLRWLLNETNYTMKNERLLPYLAVANEFLYEYLIPCFGDRWL